MGKYIHVPLYEAYRYCCNIFIHLWNFTMFGCLISEWYLNAAGSNTGNKFLGEGEINW